MVRILTDDIINRLLANINDPPANPTEDEMKREMYELALYIYSLINDYHPGDSKNKRAEWLPYIRPSDKMRFHPVGKAGQGKSAFLDVLVYALRVALHENPENAFREKFQNRLQANNEFGDAFTHADNPETVGWGFFEFINGRGENFNSDNLKKIKTRVEDARDNRMDKTDPSYKLLRNLDTYVIIFSGHTPGVTKEEMIHLIRNTIVGEMNRKIEVFAIATHANFGGGANFDKSLGAIPTHEMRNLTDTNQSLADKVRAFRDLVPIIKSFRSHADANYALLVEERQKLMHAEVWEFQRWAFGWGSSFFSDSPGNGPKSKYHPAGNADLEPKPNADEEPPVKLNQFKWKLGSCWGVIFSNNSDKDGWQYAFNYPNFEETQSKDRKNPSHCYVRRRLWQRDIIYK